jgi:hypothetical protein
MKIKGQIDMVMAIGLSQHNVALMHTVNHAYFKALLFLGAGMVVPAINLAICWEFLYQSIFIILDTEQSAGNLLYKILGILRGHTQEVINIKLFCLDYNNSSLVKLYSSLFLLNKLKLNFSSNSDSIKVNIDQKNSDRSININFNSYLAGLFEGEGCV